VNKTSPSSHPSHQPPIQDPDPDPLDVRLLEVLREIGAAGEPFAWDCEIPCRFRPLLGLAIVDEFETDHPPDELDTFEALRLWVHAQFNA